MNHIKEGFNAFNEPIFLFHDAAGELHNGTETWWVENHQTGWISEGVTTAEKGEKLFTDAVANAHFSTYR